MLPHIYHRGGVGIQGILRDILLYIQKESTVKNKIMQHNFHTLAIYDFF